MVNWFSKKQKSGKTSHFTDEKKKTIVSDKASDDHQDLSEADDLREAQAFGEERKREHGNQEKTSDDLDRKDIEKFDVQWHEELGHGLISVVVNRKSDDIEVFSSFDEEEIRDLVEDGFIKYFGDTDGIIKHLYDMGIIDEDDLINDYPDELTMDEFDDTPWIFTKQFGLDDDRDEKEIVEDVKRHADKIHGQIYSQVDGDSGERMYSKGLQVINSTGLYEVVKLG